ncbi:hypothetical protein FNF28_01298 [Cafeteria roenbergensis]|uniref:Palmitoyltransferase n=1 Tax=Cafeteria roenbergensis TaxID=33653 RepID=A0A5A8DZ52_CAFRO|nr:hypothetical protein FNF28_01298 [Cafeteria roenbergensis]
MAKSGSAAPDSGGTVSIGCGPHWPMMVVTFALILGPSVYYFARIFAVASWFEQLLAVTMLPTLLVSFTLTACSDPGIVRAEASDDAVFPRDAEAGGDAALAGVASSGLDYSSSGVDADGMVDEDTAAQRRATHGAMAALGADTGPPADLSPSYGFRQTWHERQAAAARSHLGRAAFRRSAAKAPGRYVRIAEGEPLPLDHPDLPRGVEWCHDCGVWVHGMDHHCPWTGQCIARDNTAPFYVFLVLTFTSLVFVMVSSFLRTAQMTRQARLRRRAGLGSAGGLYDGALGVNDTAVAEALAAQMNMAAESAQKAAGAAAAGDAPRSAGHVAAAAAHAAAAAAMQAGF